MRISKTAAVAFGIVAISASAFADTVSYAPPAPVGVTGQPTTIVEKKDSDEMLAMALIAALQASTLTLVATQNTGNGTVINNVGPASD